ncbi:hypothetical protein DITRI_Ditri06bG0102600 [Diplodiscus trichospermus]
MLDTTGPSVTGFWVPGEGKERVWAEIKYEKISDFCFGCERLGHVMRNCDRLCEVREIQGRKRRHGLWLKALPWEGVEMEFRGSEMGKERQNKAKSVLE